MKVVIYVDGGNVQNVVADAPGLEVMLVDYDNEAGEGGPPQRSFEPVPVNLELIEKTIRCQEY